MRKTASLLRPLAIAAFALALTACATPNGDEHKAHHLDADSPRPVQPADKPDAHSMKMNGDMMAMCAMHGKMMNAHSPVERKALMAEYMKSMPPGMQKKHMDMMQEQMMMMREHMGSQAPAQ